VFVAGQQVIQKGQAHHPQALADDYSSAVRQILV
jgi:hypothetical protein